MLPLPLLTVADKTQASSPIACTYLHHARREVADAVHTAAYVAFPDGLPGLLVVHLQGNGIVELPVVLNIVPVSTADGRETKLLPCIFTCRKSDFICVI